MSVQYWYIDDDTENTTGQIARALSVEDRIQVIPHGLETVFDNQTEVLISNGQHFDGLLLDLRLDVNKQANGKKATYTATTLAQHLRTKTYDLDVNLKDVPIVLCSYNSRIGLYYSDISSHDLFDYKFRKEEVTKQATEISNKLYDLVMGYRLIEEADSNWSRILNYDVTLLDSRIFSPFIGRTSKSAVHEYARYLLREIIHPTTNLIKEEILAARLGVDMYNSNDWLKLRDEVFGRTRYGGAFSQSWPRWWSTEVNDLFEEISNYNLSSMDAHERVSALIDRTGLTNLSPAEPIRHNNSLWYWTICEVLKTPLDPSEGFRLASGREPLAWQDYDYVSLEALLEEKLTTELDRSLHPDEVERYELIREGLSNAGTE